MGVNWDYSNQDDWPKMFPNCGKPNSSPVKVDWDTEGPFLKFLNYDANVNLIIENTGHGVHLYVQGNRIPEIEIVADPTNNGDDIQKGEVFTLARIDLHWNASEHQIISSKINNDGRRPIALNNFVMEAHLHHFNMRHYEGYDQAIQDESGGTVTLAVLFELSDTSDLDDAWFSIFNAMENVTIPSDGEVIIDKNTYLKTFKTRLGNTQLKPTTFASYIGSETSPPCRHGVKWIVAKNFPKVTANQIQQLQTLTDEKGNKILKNVRELPNV